MKFIGGPRDGEEAPEEDAKQKTLSMMAYTTFHYGPPFIDRISNVLYYIEDDGNLHYQAPQAPPKIEQEGT